MEVPERRDHAPHFGRLGQLAKAHPDDIVKENIRRFGAGIPLLNVVDKKEGF